ncbi:MAG: MFS transporter [Halobaculum sp.]
MNVQIPVSVKIKYYLYQIAQSGQMSGPIWVLFLTARGMSYTQVGALDSAFAVVIILAEAPTGYLGDRIGRRNSLLISATTRTVGSIGFALSSSFGPFVLLYALLALGQTFRSGTESAWLYDILDERFDSDQFSTIRGRGKALGKITGGAAALAGGALGSVDLALPWIASGVATGVAFVVLLTFPETNHQSEDDDSFDVTAALSAVWSQLLGSSLAPFVLYTGLFYSVVAGLNYLVQPVAVASGIDVAQIGILYAGFRVVSAGINAVTGRIENRVGGASWFRAMPFLVGIVFAAILPFRLLAIPAFFLMKAVREASRTIEQQYLNDRIEQTGRATILSSAALVHALVAIPFQLSVGKTADVVGPRTAAGVFGLVLVVGSAAVMIVTNAFGGGVLRPDTVVVEPTEATDD